MKNGTPRSSRTAWASANVLSPALTWRSSAVQAGVRVRVRVRVRVMVRVRVRVRVRVMVRVRVRAVQAGVEGR